MRNKYTKEILYDVVKTSFSVAEVVRKLNIKESGGNHSYISKKIKEYSLDITHFTGSTWNRGKVANNRKSADKVLTLNTINNRREKAWRLRRALIESGISYSCAICNIGPVWNNAELRLQVDHINQNFNDNRKENLRFLCPNCHSQTLGYSGRKYNTALVDTNEYSRIYRKKRACG